MTTRLATFASGVLLLYLLVLPARAVAQVRPGDLISAANAEKVKDLVSPGVYWAVQHDMRMNITTPTHIEWPPPYREATEKYSAQVRLSDDHRSLVGYVAGQPFPLIDANDPDAGVKVMWNSAWAPLYTDDVDVRYFEGDSVYVKPGPTSRVVEHYVYGHFASYNLVGRVDVEPMPVDPDFKITGRYWLAAFYPVLEPASVRGSGLVRHRFADPLRRDDIWSWAAGTRRLRRLNDAMMNTASDAQTFDVDHATGYNVKVEQYDYRFLGEKNMLACVNTDKVPVPTCPYDGGATSCPNNWEMRHMYIVEARPRWGERGGAGETLESKNVLYFDVEMAFLPYGDTYNRSGELWRAVIEFMGYRDRPAPDARVAIYPFKRMFIPGVTIIDVPASFATMFYEPMRKPPNQTAVDSWYINMGAVDKSFFTVTALQRAAL